MAYMDIGNKSLLDLDGSRYYAARCHLNISTSSSHGWRAIISVLDGNYHLEPQEIMEIERSSCPASALFQKLGSLMMTIDEFASYVAKTEDSVLMDIFNIQVDIQILEHPTPEVYAVEGDSIFLSVRATGFPRPMYQWYKLSKDGQERLHGANHRLLHLSGLRFTDEGTYYCLVFQGVDPTDQSKFKYTHPATITVREAPDLEVKQDPKIMLLAEAGKRVEPRANNKVIRGCNVSISCEVWGPRNMTFQWYKSDYPLTDNPRVRGSNTSELQLYHVDDDLLGSYTCVVSAGVNHVETKGANLCLQRLSKYKATDKIALLIGCGDYIGDKPLRAPPFDVGTLAAMFENLNFKVVSLINLTRNEIISAVHEFGHLVGEGVYCVFYFCGHGFEQSNEVFLVPRDAPAGYTHEKCVSAESITQFLLKKSPQLMLVILDVCRKIRDMDLRNLGSWIRQKKTVTCANLCKLYATSYGMSAYEDGQHGLVVKHLQNYLSQPYGVEDVFKKFREAISNDMKLKKKDQNQIPEVSTNLSEPERSLTDPIEYDGFTAAFNERREAWEKAHRVPKSTVREVHFADFTVKVLIEFKRVCSNALDVFVVVLDPGRASECSAWVSGIPGGIGDNPKVKIVTQAKGDKHFCSKVTLNNIHKLKNDLDISVEICCKDPDVMEIIRLTDLGLPLFSCLKLWEAREDFTRSKQPQEDVYDEEESSMNQVTSLWDGSHLSSAQYAMMSHNYKHN